MAKKSSKPEMEETTATDYVVWRGKVDMALRELNKLVGGIQGDIAVIKTSIAGFQMSLEAQSGQGDQILEDVIKLEKKVGEGVLLKPLERIAKALEEGGKTNPFNLNVPKKEPTRETPRRSTPEKTTSKKTEPFQCDLDVDDIDWKIKGGKEARDTDPFAYAFVYTSREQDEIRDSVKELHDLVEEHKLVRTLNGFLIKLGGTNNSLLNRSIPRER